MATTSVIPITPGTGLNLDAVQLTVGSNTVDRENICVADPIAASNILNVNSDGTISVKGPIQTGNAPTVATVGITSATVLAANSSRTAAVFVNNSANVMSLGFGSNAAVLYSGVTLYQGGSLVLEATDNVQQAVQAIASGASSSLGVQEFN